MEIKKCEMCNEGLELRDCYSIAGYYCIIDNQRCDDDHHTHRLCEYCEKKFNDDWYKKQQKRYLNNKKNNEKQQKQYSKQRKIEEWVNNETSNKYYQTVIVRGRKISLYLKKNYEVQFQNNDIAYRIIKNRIEWHYALEYDHRTGKSANINSHPYHCCNCFRPLKYQQTIQLLNKISCGRCKDSISEKLYYNFMYYNN
jgi:hypothetical protein